ncbi:MAG TPA: TonB-dependent receptor [Longimicrobiales bacterium]|nr:TonB-dependent receptor [Longimicrobiales bacterium]
MTRQRIRGMAYGLMAAAVLLHGGSIFAQGTGRIVGRVVDAQTGEGIANVSVEVRGTGVGALSGTAGRYVITGAPAGSAVLQAQSIGYATKTIADVMVADGAVVEQNVLLEPAAVALEAIEVSAAAERGSVGRALNEQRNASAIVNAITAEQMSRSPDGDAAAALQRVSGVTVQDGRHIFVRGLGERYTTTSLNGARIPSADPERKVVPLDLFPSGLLQTITATKTFTPDQPGDFSGAQVDIRTREFPGERQFTLSAGAGFNDRVTGVLMPAAPTEGTEWLGSAGDARALPRSVAEAGTFSSGISQDDFNTMVNDFRDVWSAERRTGRGSSSFGASLGGTDALFDHDISYLLSGTYSYGEEVRADEVRARAQAGSGGTTNEVDRFNGATGRTTVLWGGLASMSTLLGQHTRAFFNGTYNRTADNEARFEIGSSENYGGMPMQIQRLRFVERSVYSAQWGAEHHLGRHIVDWRATAAGVRRYEPDRSELVYARTDADQPFRWFSATSEGAVRTFGDLEESSREVRANYRLNLGGSGDGSSARAGVLYRQTERDAVNHAYSISATQLPLPALELTAEQIFDGRFTADGHSYMRVSPMAQGGSYTAGDRLLAVYAMLDLALGERVQIVGGARVERSELEVHAQSTLGTEAVTTSPTYTDILPSLALNLKLTDAQNLRLSVSQTLARPEYRELADVQYREVLGGENVRGNPALERTMIRNADVRWEWYPEAGGVLSLGAFAKQFDAPIERVYRATSGTSVVTFVNAESASNMGVELEARKRLGFVAEPLESLTAFANLTLMKSRIEVARSASSQTNAERRMVGQAPYVANAGLTWAPLWRGSSATVLYNVVGDRIASAGEVPLPDVVERSRHVVDVSLRTTVLRSVSLKLDAENLLDAVHEVRQGDVVRESYRGGRRVSVGVSWKQ